MGYTSIKIRSWWPIYLPVRKANYRPLWPILLPLWKYPFIYYIWTQKVLQFMGIVFPCHPLSWWGWMKNFHAFPWFWRLFVVLENICIGHTPKYSIYGHPKGQVWSADLTGRPRLIHRLGLKVKAMSIHRRTCAFEGQGWSPDHPYLIAPNPQSGLKICWRYTKPMTLCLANHIFKNLIKIKWEKHLDSGWNSVFYGHR